jgi:hypothetical protein
MAGHSSLDDEGRRVAGCGMRLAASAEEVALDRDGEGSRRRDAQDPWRCQPQSLFLHRY